MITPFAITAEFSSVTHLHNLFLQIWNQMMLCFENWIVCIFLLLFLWATQFSFIAVAGLNTVIDIFSHFKIWHPIIYVRLILFIIKDLVTGSATYYFQLWWLNTNTRFYSLSLKRSIPTFESILCLGRSCLPVYCYFLLFVQFFFFFN